MLRNIVGRSFLVAALASLCTIAVADKPSAKSSPAKSSSASKTTTSKKSESKTTAAKSSSTQGKSNAKSKEPELTGRLPRYFASIVDDDQRQEVYAVQATYREQIEALEQELKKLKIAELSAMEKVLTSTQRKKLAEMRSSVDDDSASSKPATRKTAARKSASAKTASTKKPAASKKSSKPASKTSTTK